MVVVVGCAPVVIARRCVPVTVKDCSAELLPASALVPANTALIECAPIPSLNLIEAVPLEVNCAVPSTAVPSQYLATASQKVTSPGTTGEPPAVTAAVSVTAEPLSTVPSESASVVVVLRSACDTVRSP